MTRTIQLLVWLWVVVCAAVGQRTQTLTLISSNSTPQVLSAVQLAVEHINTNPHLNFTLHLISRHAPCDHRSAQRVFYQTLLARDNQLAVIGAGCSEASTGVAEIARYYNIPMLSYSSTSEELSLRSDFPTFFRTVPSDNSLTAGIAGFIATYPEWTRVIILTQDTEQYKLESIRLVDRLELMNVTARTSLLLPPQLNQSVSASPFPADNRIFVLNMEPAEAVNVVCQAIQRGLELFDYVWILPGWYTEEWWIDTDKVQCNATSLARFLTGQGAISVGYYPLSVGDTPADVTGITASNLTTSLQSSAPYAYDAVLALALALNQTLEGLNQTLESLNQTQGETGDTQQLRQRVIHTLDQMSSFQGVSGRVDFKNGTRATSNLSVHQYRESNGTTRLVPVGTLHLYGENTSVSFITGESRTGIWAEGEAPSDGTPITMHNFPYLWITISSYLFASLVILGALFTMIFTVIFRKRKLVRLTSPNLNLVIAFGVILFNCSVFFFAYPSISDSVLEVFCALRVWTVSVGVSLCFGTVNAKMWRIYSIFHNPNPAKRKRPLKDWHLLLIVLVFVLVDVIILTPVSILESSRLAPRRVPDVEHPPSVNEDGITVNYEVTLCESDRRVIWLVLVFGYKAIVQAIGLFLALRIRNIKIKVLNDSKEIAATLYLSSAILAVVVIVSVALDDRLNLYSVIYGYGIPLSTSVVLIVVFFTKMVRLYKDPRGELIFTHHAPPTGTMVSPPTSNPPFPSKSIDHPTEDKVESLERQVRALQSDLEMYQTKNCTDDGNGNGNGNGTLNETTTTVLDDSTIDSGNGSTDCGNGNGNGALNETTTTVLDDSTIDSGNGSTDCGNGFELKPLGNETVIQNNQTI